MPPLAGRAPGPVGAALSERDTWASIIVDLHHVSVPSLASRSRRSGPEKLMLITDAMPTVGTDLEKFELPGATAYRKDGKLTTQDGTIAGSDLDMASAVRNTVQRLGIDLPTALQDGRHACRRSSSASTRSSAASRPAIGPTSSCSMGN